MHGDAGFIDAVVNNSEELSDRLIYADWLEDNGDPRGLFLRAWFALLNASDQLSTQLAKGLAGRDDVQRFRHFVDDYRRLLKPVEAEWLNRLGQIRAWVDAGIAVNVLRAHLCNASDRKSLWESIKGNVVVGEMGRAWILSCPAAQLGGVLNSGSGCVLVHKYYATVGPIESLARPLDAVQQFDRAENAEVTQG